MEAKTSASDRWLGLPVDRSVKFRTPRPVPGMSSRAADVILAEALVAQMGLL
jgi:hypothetical protein